MESKLEKNTTRFLEIIFFIAIDSKLELTSRHFRIHDFDEMYLPI